MKNNLTNLLILAVVVSLFLPGCKKQNSSGKSWQATVNGNATSGNAYSITYDVSTRTLNVQLMQAANIAYPNIHLFVSTPHNDVVPGIYSLSGNIEQAAYYSSNSGDLYNSDTNLGGGGSFNITQLDYATDKISGTFYFTAKNTTTGNANDSVVVTNGSFSNLNVVVQ